MKAGSDTEHYAQFKDFLQSACGILLGDNKQYLVRSRLRKIMHDEKLDTLGDLVTRLKSPSGRVLRDVVIDAMTTNETLWFRDNHPYRILKDILLPQLHAAGNRNPRIWSAACSTGQEPYSITMIADEYKRSSPSNQAFGVQVVATDISQTVLNAAKRGEYEMLAIGRGLSDERQKRYFTQSAEGMWRVNADIQRSVDFRSLNLLDRYTSLGRFDVIFCRNVLIYFSAELKKDILTRMHQVLKPGGYLVLGASESLNGLPECYEMVQCRPGIIYKAV